MSLLLVALLPLMVSAQCNCGGSSGYVATSMVLTSPNYNYGNYPANCNCVWTFTTDPGKTFRITFTAFQTDYRDHNHDYLNIHDGDSTSDFVFASCGGTNPPQTQVVQYTTENAVTFRFVSSNNYPGRGFSLQISSVPDPMICTYVLEVPTNFTSSNYPNNYDNNLKCVWRLFTAQECTIYLEFPDFNTEKNWDFVYIFDGNSTADTKMATCTDFACAPITSSGNMLTVQLYTDVNQPRKGFKAVARKICPTTTQIATTTAPQPTTAPTCVRFFQVGGLEMKPEAILETSTMPSETDCGLRCLNDPLCVAFHYETTTFECLLSSKHPKTHPDSFQSQPNSMFFVKYRI